MSSGSDIEKFIDRFMSRKVEVIQKTMLHSIREESGLVILTTNASESINALLKHNVDYKNHQLLAFIDKVRKSVDKQKQEVERAIVNHGKWHLRAQYRFLEVQECVVHNELSTSELHFQSSFSSSF